MQWRFVPVEQGPEAFSPCIAYVHQHNGSVWCRSQHLNPGKYKQNRLREKLITMARQNKRELPAGVSSCCTMQSYAMACPAVLCCVCKVLHDFVAHDQVISDL